MGQVTLSQRNINKPAPKWFRKTKKAVSIMTMAANVMVQSWGLPDPLLVAKIQLWCTIGISAIMEALETLLANGEEYASDSQVKEAIEVIDARIESARTDGEG